MLTYLHIPTIPFVPPALYLLYDLSHENYQQKKTKNTEMAEGSMVFAAATTGRCSRSAPVLPSTASAKSNRISSNKCMGRMPTWDAFIGRNTVWFLQLPLLAGARDRRQCYQAQQVQNLTIFLPINVLAECRLGVHLLEEIWYGFCSCHYWQVLAIGASAAKHSKCKIQPYFFQ